MAHILNGMDHLMEGDENWLPDPDIENDYSEPGLADPGMWSPGALEHYPWDNPQDHALRDILEPTAIIDGENVIATPNNTLMSEHEDHNDNLVNQVDSPLLHSPTHPTEGYPKNVFNPTNNTNNMQANWLGDFNIGSPGHGFESASRFSIDEDTAWQQSPWSPGGQQAIPNDLLNTKDLALLTSIMSGAPQEGTAREVNISIEDFKVRICLLTLIICSVDLMITNPSMPNSLE